MTKDKIVVPVVCFLAGIAFLIIINPHPYRRLLDEYPQLYIDAPKGYEISSGYRDPYFNDKGLLRWRDKQFKNAEWYPSLKESGSAIFTDSTADIDIVIFIRKKKP